MNFKRASIVLGAGASKGARLGIERTPPLDSEFLAVAADYFHRKKARNGRQPDVTAWRLLQRHLKAAGLNTKETKHWRLEQLSTFLEARASLKGLQLGQGRPRDYSEALEALKVAVCHTLRMEGGTRPCSLHRKLFELVRPSAVVTFNYDLVADQSMLAAGLLDWRRPYYRGATYARVPGTSGYVRVPRALRKKGTPLLKLHGSVNWARLSKGDGYRLSGCEFPNTSEPRFSYSEVPEDPYIVPPVAAKIQIRQKALRTLWRQALHSLHDAPAWIIWGYSFPITDTISQVLFRTALAKNRKPKPVIVVNPDASVVSRIKDVCQKVSVKYYPSMERFLLDEGGLLDSEGEK